MADTIKFDYSKMTAAAADIRAVAGQYANAAKTFQTDFATAIAGWEGDSKDKMQKFISGTVKEYTENTVPQLLNALADLLDANAQQMKNADAQIAANIPG